MLEKANESLRKLAEEYVHCIISNKDNIEKVRKLREKLGFSNIQVSERAKESNYMQQGKVGIWKKIESDGKKYFIRDEKYKKEFPYWAKVETIPPKSEKIRIAYLGESGARGFLYDPFFTPAIFLEKALNKNLTNKEAEVIDLARVSIKIHELEKVSIESKHLQPDIVMIFAGDNWRKSLWKLTEKEINQMIEVMDMPDRFARIRRILEEKCDKLIKAFMKSIYDNFIVNNLPVFFIIPEFNLKDWKINDLEKVLCWPDGETEEWMKIKVEAENQLEAGNFERVVILAQRMIELNESNPCGYELLGNVMHQLGRNDEARYYLEAARDTHVFRLAPPPACTSIIRNKILQYGKKYKINTIDLREIFKKYLNGDIPGNELFIDYCHLSVKGIKVSMNHVARAVLNTIEDGSNNKEFEALDFQPSNEIMSKAHFYSAVHSAHIGDQPYENLYNHCKRSLQLWSEISQTMIQYTDITSRKIPWALNKNYSSFYSEQYVALRQFNDCMTMDIELTRAIVNALKDYGIDIEDKVNALRIAEHKPSSLRKVSLLETYYRENSYFNVFLSSKSVDYYSRNQCYYSSRNVKSKFYLIADKVDDIKCEITLRCPLQLQKETSNKVTVKVNRTIILEMLVDEGWRDYCFQIPSKLLLSSGVNIMEINWPYSDTSIARTKKAYKMKYSGYQLIMKRSKPTYGDILKFNAYVQ